jgi:hypothetical protein
MPINYNRISHIIFLPIGSWLVIITAVFAVLPLLTGCASLVEKGLLPEVVARRPPDLQLGPELILHEKPPIMSSSLIDKEGAAHVFVVDKERQLNHIEILGDKITAREVLGIIEAEQVPFLDTIEHPPGKLHVLAGDKQYLRAAPNLEWQEIRGNRCARFVPVGDDLFCAFVIKGEEAGAPERTDYTVGWFLLVPIFYWSHVHASKLVLAQETPHGWIIRAVVDPEMSMDTDDDFMVASDSLGNIHFLYFTSKGGGAFYVFAYYPGAGAGGISPEPKLRYARLKFDRIVGDAADARNQASNKNRAPMKWIPVTGVPLTHKPFIKLDSNYNNAYIVLRPLSRNFSINKATGEVHGLMYAGQCTLDDGERQLPLFGPDRSWVEVNILDEKWSPYFNIVTAEDFPTSGYSWHQFEKEIKTDSKGNLHALLGGLKPSFWTAPRHINYLVKIGDNWSAPLTLGGGNLWSYDSSLAVTDFGVAFAAWVNEKGQFIGRWIKPRSEVP